jgi:ankyrin repeat protein
MFCPCAWRLVHRAQPQAVGILHRAGASPNAQDHDLRTPLHSARDAEVAQALLGAGALVNARDVFGRTPLHSAVSPDCVRVLVARGALVNAPDKEGRTPLDAASTSERR